MSRAVNLRDSVAKFLRFKFVLRLRAYFVCSVFSCPLQETNTTVYWTYCNIKTKFAWNNCIFSGLKHVHESSRMTDVVFMWTTFNPSFTELEVTVYKQVGIGHTTRPCAARTRDFFMLINVCKTGRRGSPPPIGNPRKIQFRNKAKKITVCLYSTCHCRWSYEYLIVSLVFLN